MTKKMVLNGSNLLEMAKQNVGSIPHGDLFPQRKRREFTPDFKKDQSYWERRRRNNEAAKRSREKRRLNDMILETKVMELSKDNAFLRAQLTAIFERYGIRGESLINFYDIQERFEGERIVKEEMEWMSPSEESGTPEQDDFSSECGDAPENLSKESSQDGVKSSPAQAIGGDPRDSSSSLSTLSSSSTSQISHMPLSPLSPTSSDTSGGVCSSEDQFIHQLPHKLRFKYHQSESNENTDHLDNRRPKSGHLLSDHNKLMDESHDSPRYFSYGHHPHAEAPKFPSEASALSHILVSNSSIEM
ncbi:hypothetical protein TCAL_01646 [Tigriopus californicus]|uniref:BZIP domain-containing protein n=1 Tax=Tigriopus californicus TaxID=6832 RepID=A0A553PA77_TIGCA|nr:hypothetical protein TCAL_01646 [Tigriopus californicus]|eukprot:TCALIF_01646-PA protein Name:"Similar to nfil3 Nuclear factor interleukin-3-regulated protein (Danio rerio)" AED:0.05 eAED:0.05 QI:0/0/0.5/0.5/1/1/2/298/301